MLQWTRASQIFCQSALQLSNSDRKTFMRTTQKNLQISNLMYIVIYKCLIVCFIVY